MTNRVLVLEKYLIDNNIIDKNILYSNELLIYFRKMIEDADYKHFFVNCVNKYKAILNNQIIEYIEDDETGEGVEYLNRLIAKYLKIEYGSIDDLIENIEMLEEDLQIVVHQYEDLKLPLGVYLDLIENLLKEKDILHLFQNLVETTKYTNSEKRIVYLIIEIIKVCGIPYSDEYLIFLKTIFIKLDKINIYNRLNDTFDLLEEEVNIYENELENIIKQVNDVPQSVLMTSIFKSKFSGILTSNQIDTLQNELEFIYKIKDLNDKSIIDEILNEKIYIELGPLLSSLTTFEVILSQNENINDLKRRLKYFDYDDEYITNTLKLYDIKAKKTDHIVVNTPNPLIDDIWLSIFNEYKYSLTLSKLIKKYLKINIEKTVHDIFMDMIFQTNKHFIKSFDYLLENVQNVDFNFFNTLFYNYNDDKQIRVFCKNVLEEYLLYCRNQLTMIKKENNIENNKYTQLFLFIVDKITKFIVEYDIPYMGDSVKFIDFIMNENLQIVLSDITIVHPTGIPSIYLSIINEIIDLTSDVKSNDLHKNIIKMSNIISKKINEYKTKFIKKQLIPSYISKIIKLNKNLTKETIHFLSTSYSSNLLKGLSGEKADDERLGGFLNMYVANINNFINEKVKINSSKNILTKKYDLDKEVAKYLKGEFQQLKAINAYQPKQVVYTNEESKVYLDASNFYQENTLSFNDINITKKYLAEKRTNEDIIRSLKVLAKNNYIKLMKFYFKRQINQKELDEIMQFIDFNFSKINTIKKILLKFSKKTDDFSLTLTENSVIKDIMMMFVIIYIVDNYINASKDITKIDFENVNFENKKFLNNVVILKKDNNIGKIKKENEDNVVIEFDGKELIVKKDDFIDISDMNNQAIKITSGVFKGKLGVLTSLRESVEADDIKKQYIKYLEESLINKLEYINKIKVDKNTLYTKKEKDIISSIRKINKVKTTSNNKIQLTEFIYIEGARIEHINAINKEIINLRTQLKIVGKQINETYYNIKINIGSMEQRTVHLSKNQFRIIESKKEQIKLNKTPLKFDTIYSFIKYLFFSANIIELTNVNLYQITFIQTLYKKILDLYNNSKMMNINKLVLIKKIDLKIRKFNLTFNRIQKQKNVDASKIKLLKDTIQSLNIKKINLEKDIGKLSKYNIREINSTLEKYSKEYELKKEEGIKYYLLKYNTAVLNKEKMIFKKEEDEQNEKYQQMINKKTNKLIKNGLKTFEQFNKKYSIDILDNQTCDLISLFE